MRFGFELSEEKFIETFRKSVCFYLIERGYAERELSDVVQEDFLNDMKKVYFLDMAEKENGIFRHYVNEDNLTKAGVDREELKRLAMENTLRLYKPEIKGISGVVIAMMERAKPEAGEDLDAKIEKVRAEAPMVDERMFYLSDLRLGNNKGTTGGCYLAINEVLDWACESIGAKAVFILPCSTHELLVIPRDKLFAPSSVEGLTRMVHEVNEAEVMPYELLSNDVYFYERGSDGIRTAEEGDVPACECIA